MVHLGFSAGHGIYTPGKRIPKSFDSNETSEWTMNNWDLTNTMDILMKEYEDVKISRLDDPTGQRDVPLSERSSKANTLRVDAVVDFHHNAGGGTGIEVYKYLRATEGTTDALAKAIYDTMIKYTGNKGNRATPIKREDFHMVRETLMPAVLIENGYMDHQDDVKKILTKEYSLLSGRGVAEAIAAIYGLKKKVIAPPPKPTNNVRRVVVDGKQIGAYSVNSNILNEVKKALDQGAKKIEINMV